MKVYRGLNFCPENHLESEPVDAETQLRVLIG